MSNTVPEGWEKAKFQDVADLIKGLTYSTSDYSSKDSGHPFITLKCIQKNGGFSKRGLKYYSGKYKESQTVKAGDVVFANTDLTRDGDVVGSPLLVPKIRSNKPSLISMDLSKVVPSHGHNGGFIYYWLQTTEVKRQMINLSAGSTVLHLNTREVPYLCLVVPPLPEQQKIAAVLSSVDDVIEKTRAQIDKLKDLKTGMMQELLTKGIGSGGAPHTEFKDSPVGRIPISWGVAPCGAVCNTITDGEHLSPKYVEKGFPILSAKDMRDYGIDLGGAKFVAEQAFTKMLKRCKPEHGDVLIVSRGATIGKTTLNNCTTPFALMGSVILLKPNQKCLGEFLSLFIASPFVQQSMLQLSGSSAQQAIYLRDIKDMPTPIPPIDEQKKIAYSIRSIDSRIQALTHKLNASEDLKKSMMQDLLTGKVRVNVDQKESAVA